MNIKSLTHQSQVLIQAGIAFDHTVLSKTSVACYLSNSIKIPLHLQFFFFNIPFSLSLMTVTLFRLS